MQSQDPHQIATTARQGFLRSFELLVHLGGTLLEAECVQRAAALRAESFWYLSRMAVRAGQQADSGWGCQNA
jgi:hypothetical protein